MKCISRRKIYTDVARTDANAKTIELGRYDFDESGVKSAYSGSYVEEDKGNIYVDSDEKGTIFTVKYFHI